MSDLGLICKQKFFVTSVKDEIKLVTNIENHFELMRESIEKPLSLFVVIVLCSSRRCPETPMRCKVHIGPFLETVPKALYLGNNIYGITVI